MKGKIIKKKAAHKAAKPHAAPAKYETMQAPAGLPETVKLAVKALNDKKGEDIKVLDVRAATPMWDYFIVCGGTSTVHTGALRDNLKKDMAAAGYTIAHEDRDHEHKWLVVDFGDILVHLFERETRGYYNLEAIWSGHEADISALIKGDEHEKSEHKA